MRKLIATLSLLALVGTGRAETIDPTLFTHRAPVTFPTYNLESTLENFPVLVRLTSAEGKFTYDEASIDGSDVRFALEDGTLLPSEVSLWNPEGESLVWVSVPALNGNAKIMLYWGGEHEFPSSQTDGTVWSAAGYFGVWHMDEAAGAEKAKDSAGGAMEGTHVGTSPGQDGFVGRSVRISNGGWNVGDGKGITTAAFSNIGDKFMFSLWTKYPNQNPGTDRLGSTKIDWTATSGWEISTQRYNQQKIDFRGSGQTNPEPGVSLKNTDWQYLTFLFNGAEGSVYINNSWKAGGKIDAVTDSDYVFTIGNMSNLSADSFKGWLDEVRLYKGEPTRDWISAEYHSVQDTGFTVVGDAEILETEAPVLGELTLVSAELHAASLGWELRSAGSSATEVSLAYGIEEGIYTITNVIAGGMADRTSDTLSLSDLRCGTTYYAKLIAKNTAGSVSSPERVFTTPGVPEFSDVSLVIEDGAATATATLTSGAGTANVSAKCVFGNRVESPEEIGNWTVTTSPAGLTATKSGVSEGHYLAHFEVTSSCPVCEHAITVVSDEVEAAVAGTYEWTGAAGDSCWGTPGNWSVGDVPTAVDTVIFGANVTEGLVVELPEKPLAAARLIRVASANSFTIGTKDGPVMPAVPFEIAEGAGLVTVDATFDFATDATLALAAGTEIDLRRVTGTKNLVIDGGGTVKLLKVAGDRTDGETLVNGGVLLISESGQLGRKLTIGGAGKPAVARSNGAPVGSRPFGNVKGSTFVLDQGTFDLETDGVSDHWQKEMCGPISVASGGKFLPGKRRIQLTNGGVPVLTLEGAIEGGSGTFNFPDDASLVVPETADAAPVVEPGMTITQRVRFDIADIPDAPVDTTIRGSIGFGWASRDAFWKIGAGVLRVTGKNTYGGGGTIANGEGTTQIQEGTLLVDNDPSVYGSGTGNSLIRVDGGTVLGGTGRIGGLTEEVKTWSGTGNGKNTRVTAKGADGKQAVIWPGTIGTEGEHVNGTLTVGIDEVLAGEEEKRVLHHPVTFSDYSTLKIVVGRDKADALAVNGAVDVSATGTRLEIGPIDEVTRLKSGTYTILSAMDGITNEFSEVVVPKRSWKVEKVNARQLDDGIEVYDALTLTVPGSGMLMIVR